MHLLQAAFKREKTQLASKGEAVLACDDDSIKTYHTLPQMPMLLLRFG
jgi:hypothetical protein